LEEISIILKGCSRKEHKYQKMLYENYFGFALKIVFRYIYRYEKAIDITNDGFIKFFSHFESFNPGRPEDSHKILMGFLKRIMINTAIDDLRKNKMIPEIGGIPEYVWDIQDKNSDADQLIMYKELIILIKELPPHYSTVFNLYVIDGYNHPEIAEKLGIPVGSSKSALSRARLILQKKLKKQDIVSTCNI
jgi:RNA polymerase sigma factor (sigma-70 family)